jgi:hypothetical protein
MFSAFDEIDLDEEDDEEEDDDEEQVDQDEKEMNVYGSDESQRMVIENEYVAEKLSSLYCLQEICKHLNPELLDYYSECYAELKNLSLYVHSNIRKEAYGCMAHLISYCHDWLSCTTSGSVKQYEVTLVSFNNSLREFHINSVKTIKMDADRQLVMDVYDAIRTLLQRCAPYLSKHYADYADALRVYGELVLDTFNNKIYCQVINKDADDQDEENLAEYDHMLKEYAGDVIPSLALCLPEVEFDKYFEKVLVYLIRLLNKPETTLAEKSFVIGVIGESISNVQMISLNRSQQLFAGKVDSFLLYILLNSFYFKLYFYFFFKKSSTNICTIMTTKYVAIRYLLWAYFVLNHQLMHSIPITLN